MSTTAHLLLNLALAWAAGSAVGLERSYQGRTAGFRTHGIVALATAMTVSIAAAPKLLPGVWPDVPGWFDPSRLVQGVMAGIGFLGAGVIFKEGVSIQGLTTAASIYAAAAIGLALGLGLWPTGIAVTAAVLASLTLLRMLEGRLPSRIYAQAALRFRAEDAPSDAALQAILAEAGMSLEDMSYRLCAEGRVFEVQGSLATSRRAGFAALAERLRTVPGLVEFDILRVSK
jgi:putative Mg2+ transporter-C (MgtC) family protein